MCKIVNIVAGVGITESDHDTGLVLLNFLAPSNIRGIGKLHTLWKDPYLMK